MIESLKEIYKIMHGSSIVDLGKIVRQKSASYLKLPRESEDLKIEPAILLALDEKGLIKLIDDNQLIMLPLGYAIIESKLTKFIINDEFDLLRKLYNEQCAQIIEPLSRDDYSELDCALGFFILNTGSISDESRFPFIKSDKTYEYYSAIEYNINYISFRLFYCFENVPKQLRDEIEFRNILGRNNKSGNLKKKTKLHKVENDRGRGTVFHWFEIKEISADTKFVLDGLMFGKKEIIPLLNLKKISLDNLLVNTLPYEMKNKMGERTSRSLVLQEIVSYVNRYLETYNATGNMTQDERDNLLENNLGINLSDSYLEISVLYRDITQLILSYPKIGMFLIEIHYRLAKVKNIYETNESLTTQFLSNFPDILGDDFIELLEESRELCKQYYR